LGEFVTHIGEGAFGDCTFLASVRFGEFVAHMGKVPFTIDSLEGICLSEFVTTGEGAFERLHFLDKHSFWVYLWLILWRVPFNAAILWVAFLWVSL